MNMVIRYQVKSQKLMQLSACVQSEVSEQELAALYPGYQYALQHALQQSRLGIEKQVNDRNLSFFEQEVNKLDSWADDLKEGLEQSIKSLISKSSKYAAKPK